MSWIESFKSTSWIGLLEGLAPRRLASGATPIVPPGSVAGRALTVVIAIMCFLACLTAGAVYMVNQSASAWFDDIASEVTVQINPSENSDIEKQVTLVALYLAKQPGIRRVTPMSAEQSGQLLEPWLGSGSAISALPVPRLIAVEIDRSSPPDLNAIGEALKTNFPAAALDDHRRWQAQIQTVTRSLALGGIAVLFLVAAATVATIVSATRSAMASNREIIEVLHLVGAKETFIAREFEKHFLAVGVRAGLVGAVAASIVFTLMPVTMRVLGGGTLAAAEFRRLVGPAVLDLPGYVLFILVVIVVASLCMLTTRFGVYRILKTQQ
ncbi:MAG: cell division protein FtsX [Methyloligellaceae bacterium]